jgi:CheY-like chemotaxis protein
MKFQILLLDTDPATAQQLMMILPKHRAELVTATNTEEATRLADEYVPHAVILEADPTGFPRPNFMEWLAQARTGALKDAPALVFTRSVSPETVRYAMALHIDSYLLKPSNPFVLAEKVRHLLEKLEAKGGMSFVAVPGGLPDVRVTTEGKITGISETGCCVRSAVISSIPIPRLDYTTPFFDQLGTRSPRLHFLNTGTNGSEGGSLPFNNYCLFVGWRETDRRSVRKWICENRLESVVLHGNS